MGLFSDGNMPAGVRSMFENMIRAAAPDLAKQIDGFGQLVVQCQHQLNRIEGKLDTLISMQTPGDIHGAGSNRNVIEQDGQGIGADARTIHDNR